MPLSLGLIVPWQYSTQNGHLRHAEYHPGVGDRLTHTPQRTLA